MTKAELAQLKMELDTDPLGLRYAGQPNTQGMADLLNNPALSGAKIANTSVLVDDIMKAVDVDELPKIPVNKMLFFMGIGRKDAVDISKGSAIKSQIANIFTQADAPNTRAALEALKDRNATRGEILFGINTRISHTDVGLARQVK